ncbi:hypothetical protein [Nonomuraea sp. KM90]|uniref:hypothetical protein n=1 Tax=Nonomuraea sp. KM90 TaxID=3457428 RepID=UPI003FCC2F2A
MRSTSVAPAMLCRTNVRRRTLALRGCSLSVPAGRVAVLTGPNGADKITLMHATAN